VATVRLDPWCIVGCEVLHAAFSDVGYRGSDKPVVTPSRRISATSRCMLASPGVEKGDFCSGEAYECAEASRRLTFLMSNDIDGAADMSY
jgi:hypothetical protein